MKRMAVLAMTLVLVAFGGMFVSPASADPIFPIGEIPIFESHGNVNFEGGTGAGWWNFNQYEERAVVNIGAYSTEKVISVQKSMVVDRNDPSWFSFSVSMRMLDNTAPTGLLDFSSYSSNGENYLSMQVADHLQDVWDGWDEANQLPIYRQEMWANFHADLYADVMLRSVNDSFGHWSSEWYDDQNNLYYRQSGDEFQVYGYGRLLGENPSAIGQGLVEGGFASYGTVPEPCTIALLSTGGLLLLRKKRQ